ncbi:hypothetical protein PENTCL1PPCAC_6355 [Pristionchus entomophagus]|uniref:RRM domain-containing protein n=1 Tax=Pristionchus entomophagus TaxID=358040 RepID=A0AAV5SVT0_9BILA|nr:hypothetical protein PENTCL1PPCAC_6355 [Pristionchus entomophagus]
MFSSSSDFDSSLDASAQQELSNDGSCDIASSGSKKPDNKSEISSLFASWNNPDAPTMSETGKARDVLEEEECFIDNRIYISNIPFSYTSVDLEKIFSNYGKVIAAQVVTNERGSKGFGFVTLETAIACDAARQELDGTIMGGRKIEVKKARQMQHSRVVLSGGLTRNGNTRSLLSPSLLYQDTSSFIPPFVGNNNLHGLGALSGQSNAANAQLMAQLQLAQLQSIQTTHLLNLLASQQPTVGGGLGQTGLPLQNALLNSLINPLGMGAASINPFGLDTSALLRQNANLNGLTGLNGLNGLTLANQTDPLTSLYSSMDMSSLDALNAASFLRPGGVVSSGSNVALNGGVMRMSAPPSLSFDISSTSTNRKRPALALLPDYPIAHKNGRFGG